jgi:CTP synthase (UTP-ammonia lyase)
MSRPSPLRIAILGDREPSRPTHGATDAALSHAAHTLSLPVEARWLPTPALEAMPEHELARFAGFLVAPGSPYRSLDGALRGIRHAREAGRPLFGTCGGFQHVVLEIARNVLGREQARHAEYDPDAPDPVIAPLACSLAGTRAAVRLTAGSRAAACYGAERVHEEYRCSFGLAAEWLPALARAGLVVSGTDERGEPRVVELADHPFGLATLYVPQLASEPGRPHPLFLAFMRAAARGAEAGTAGRSTR